MKTIIDFANKVKSLVDGRMTNIANVETSPSTHAYAVGKQLIFNGLLCKATSAIAVGDTLAVGTNLALSDNVVEQIYSLNQGLTNSLNNLAPAYDPTITYNVDDLVTAEGKLYKCIVAVATPEQFDINKWDDVTTSEVYARSDGNMYAITTSSYTVPSDTSITRSQFIVDALAAFITNVTSHLADEEYIIITNVHFDYLDLLFESFFKFSNSTSAFPNYTNFSAITLINDQYLSINTIHYLNTATFKHAQIDTTNSNVTSGDKGILTNETDMIITYTKYKKI